MLELNQCFNAANDLLRADDPIKAELVAVIIKKAFALGQESAKNAFVDTIGKLQRTD